MNTSDEPRQFKSNPKIRAILFDFLGTLLDWHTPIISKVTEILQANTADLPLSPNEISSFALDWRAAFFRAIAARHAQGLPPEDIDTTHQATLTQLLESYPNTVRAYFTPAQIDILVAQWHSLPAWPDVLPALQQLKASFPDIELFVLANGTTRLQLDLLRSSGLSRTSVISMAFSSQLLGCYKPDHAAYLKALDLVGLDQTAEGAVMVAAHAYDLRAARRLTPNGAGMRTIYVRRWTEDYGIGEDFEQIRRENDAYIDEEDFAALVETVRQLDSE